MNISIIYSSKTGNTRRIAEAIKEELSTETIVYFGKPTEKIPDADIYFIGSWTDKGNASEDILNFAEKLENKKIAYFGTAGYGGSVEYYNSLFERAKSHMASSNQILGYFYCQGKMPVQIRSRYVSLLTQNPEDANLKVNLENFDAALSHPDEKDVREAKEWTRKMVG